MMTQTDLRDYLPRLAALRDRLGVSVDIEFRVWLRHRYLEVQPPPTYAWSIWDGTTHHYGATLEDALRAVEHAHAHDGESTPIDVLVLPDNAVYDEIT